MTNDERDEYIKKTHDTVITLVADVRNHVDNRPAHHIPPCATLQIMQDRNWKTSLALFMASLSCIGALVLLLIQLWAAK